MQMSRLFVMSVIVGSALAACGDDGGKGGGIDAPKQIDAPSQPIDAPAAAITGLGQKCVQSMMGADCPADAPLCVGFAGTPTYCSPRCVTNGTATGAAMNQFMGITPAPSNALCSAAYRAGAMGMPVCAAVLNNYMPADNPVVVGKAYTNINMTCAVLCVSNACPPGFAVNNSLGVCACFPQ